MQLNDVVLQSKRNPFIKKIAQLKNKKAREKSGLFIFEGEKLFLEAIDWHVTLQDIVISETRFHKREAFYRHLFRDIDDTVQCTVVSDNVLSYLSEQVHPEGVLCVAKKAKSEPLSLTGNALVLDNVRDPGNLGTMIRTADAAGFNAIYCLKNTVDPYNEKTIRAAMGSLFHLPVITEQDASRLFKTLKSQGLVICAASLNGKTSLISPAGDRQTALVIGNESHGIRPEVETLCDIKWRLPIYGSAESLNAAMAAGILMYTIVREQKNN